MRHSCLLLQFHHIEENSDFGKQMVEIWKKFLSGYESISNDMAKQNN